MSFQLRVSFVLLLPVAPCVDSVRRPTKQKQQQRFSEHEKERKTVAHECRQLFKEHHEGISERHCELSGLGMTNHIETRRLWMQDKTLESLRIVPTEACADIESSGMQLMAQMPVRRTKTLCATAMQQTRFISMVHGLDDKPWQTLVSDKRSEANCRLAWVHVDSKQDVGVLGSEKDVCETDDHWAQHWTEACRAKNNMLVQKVLLSPQVMESQLEDPRRSAEALSGSRHEGTAREESNRLKSSSNNVWLLEGSQAQTPNTNRRRLVRKAACAPHASDSDSYQVQQHATIHLVGYCEVRTKRRVPEEGRGVRFRFSGLLCGCTFFQFFLRSRSFTSSDTHVVNVCGETDSHWLCLAFDFLQIRVTAKEFNDANKNGPHVCFPQK